MHQINHRSADVAHRDEREREGVGKEEEVKKNKKEKHLNVYEKVKKMISDLFTCIFMLVPMTAAYNKNK